MPDSQFLIQTVETGRLPRFGIFDTFADEPGRNAHLNGEIAKALFARAGELLASPPQIGNEIALGSFFDKISIKANTISW